MSRNRAMQEAFDRALHGPGLLSEKVRRLMQTPNLNGYGYGLSIKPPDEHVSRRTSVGHTGGLPDRSAVLRRFVGDEVTLIVLSNLPQAAITAVKEIERLYFAASPTLRDMPPARDDDGRRPAPRQWSRGGNSSRCRRVCTSGSAYARWAARHPAAEREVDVRSLTGAWMRALGGVGRLETRMLPVVSSRSTRSCGPLARRQDGAGPSMSHAPACWRVAEDASGRHAGRRVRRRGRLRRRAGTAGRHLHRRLHDLEGLPARRRDARLRE